MREYSERDLDGLISEHTLNISRSTAKGLRALDKPTQNMIASYSDFILENFQTDDKIRLSDFINRGSSSGVKLSEPARLNGRSALSYASHVWGARQRGFSSPPGWFSSQFGIPAWMFRSVPKGETAKSFTLLVRLSWANRLLSKTFRGNFWSPGRIVEGSLNRYSVSRCLRTSAKLFNRFSQL
jgi:hypothetical protein